MDIKGGLTSCQKFREPLSIFTQYKTTVTPKINILTIIIKMIIKMFIFGVTVVLYFLTSCPTSDY